MTLYEITDELRGADEALDAITGLRENTADTSVDQLEKAVIDHVAILTKSFGDKVEGWLKLRVNAKKEAEKLEEEIARLTRRKKSLEAKADYVTRTVRDCMEAAKIRNVRTPLFTAWLQETAASARINDPKQVPPIEFADKVTVEPLALAEGVTAFVGRFAVVACNALTSRRMADRKAAADELMDMANLPPRLTLEAVGVKLSPGAFSRSKVAAHAKAHDGKAPEGFSYEKGISLHVS